ncbi:MAG: hypothetical protein IJY16_07080 [Clostridia bacterium]|nr:hypothetical protein [Clostridia bacterium]
MAMAGREAHDYFVPYERIAFLGKLVGFHTSASRLTFIGGTYCYDLISPDGVTMDVDFNGGRVALPYPSNFDFPMIWRVDGYYESEGDMRYLNVSRALEKETYYDRSYEEFLVGFYVQLDFGTYYYNTDGMLTCIGIKFSEGQLCKIFADFDKCSSDSWAGRLVRTESAQETTAEMILRFSGLYKEPWEQPLIICLSAIGGAVVATLITFLVMRKKRGAPAPAVAGVPAVEVLAGSDGDVSAAPSVAAPALPENPASPESPAPPEEDTKTDTPGRS